MNGLSEQEVQQRRAAGLDNNVDQKGGRSYFDIARANLFTLFNNILFVIGIALIAMGRINDAITSVGIGLVNALISTLQEIRAKRQLDQISLLTKPTVTVVRDGEARDKRKNLTEQKGTLTHETCNFWHQNRSPTYHLRSNLEGLETSG